MKTHRMAPREWARGFGLVELMVGLAVGLVTILVITQVFASFEGQKRTTSGTGDIQTNGAFAIYQIEREVRMAGYGLVGTGGLLCPLGANVAVDAYAAPAAAPLAPAHIVDGGAGPDTLTVARSASPTTAIPGTLATFAPGVVKASPSSVQKDNVFMLASARGDKVCSILKATSVTGSPVSTITYAAPPATVVIPAYQANDIVVDMGSMVMYRYEICPRGLVEYDLNVVAPGTACDDPPPPGVRVIAADVVDMQVLYGVTPAESPVVNLWTPATGGWSDATLSNPANAAEVARIKAVRIALVLRGSVQEKEDVSPATIKLWQDLAYDYAVPDRKFRYRVFETLIPLRNVIWSNM